MAAETSSDYIRAWLTIMAFSLVLLPLLLYILFPSFWLYIYPVILTNLQFFALAGIALGLYYHVREVER